MNQPGRERPGCHFSLEPLQSSLSVGSLTHFYDIFKTISLTGMFSHLQFLPVTCRGVSHADVSRMSVWLAVLERPQCAQTTSLLLSGSCPVREPNSLLKTQKYSHKTCFSCGTDCSFHMGQSVKLSFYGRSRRLV